MVSSPENVTGFLDFITKLNTGDVFYHMGPSLLIMVFMVFFVGLVFAWDTLRSLLGACLLTTILGIFLSIVGIVNWVWVFPFVVGSALLSFKLYNDQQ